MWEGGAIMGKSKIGSNEFFGAKDEIKYGTSDHYREILTLKQTCEFLQLSERNVRELVATKKIPHSRINKSIRFLTRSLVAWVKAGEILPVDKENL
jgi:predicted DNA-binding transcriptional regulator AlpA